MQEIRMRKLGERGTSLTDVLRNHFSWVDRITKTRSNLPCSERYEVAVNSNISDGDSRIFEFEQFAEQVFEVQQRRASVICCWQTTGVTLYVFS